MVAGRCIELNSSALFVSCRSSRTLHIYSTLMRYRGSTYVQGLRTRQQPFQATHATFLKFLVQLLHRSREQLNRVKLLFHYPQHQGDILIHHPRGNRSRWTYWKLTKIEVCFHHHLGQNSCARCVKVGYPSWSNSNLGWKNLSGEMGPNFLGEGIQTIQIYISCGNFQGFPEISKSMKLGLVSYHDPWKKHPVESSFFFRVGVGSPIF